MNPPDWFDMERDARASRSTSVRRPPLVEQELKEALRLEQRFLPRPQQLDALEFAWRFEPLDTLGGDIFDVHVVDGERMSLYMIDVSGHDAGAALIAISAFQFIRDQHEATAARGTPSPEDVLAGLRASFPFDRFERFFSIAYVTVDLKLGALTAKSAGHPPPILLRADGSMHALDRHECVIGVEPEPGGRTHQLPFGEGDRLVLYTDGLLDLADARRARFGSRRLREALRAHKDEPIQEMIDSVYGCAREFAGGEPSEDDISVLAVEGRAAREHSVFSAREQVVVGSMWAGRRAHGLDVTV